MALSLALTLVSFMVWHTAGMVSAGSGQAGVGTVVHVHAGQRLRQHSQWLIVDYHLE